MVEITIKVVIKCTKIPNLYPKKTDNNNIKKLKKRERRGGDLPGEVMKQREGDVMVSCRVQIKSKEIRESVKEEDRRVRVCVRGRVRCAERKKCRLSLVDR
jgi:hypothetical protein